MIGETKIKDSFTCKTTRLLLEEINPQPLELELNTIFGYSAVLYSASNNISSHLETIKEVSHTA